MSILQISTFTNDIIIGIALMFGMALILTYLTFRDLRTFFIWLTIFAGFVVWGGLLDLWVLILCLVILAMIIISMIYKKNGGIE